MWPAHDVLNRKFGRKHAMAAMEEMMTDLKLSGFRAPRVEHRGKAWGLIAHHESGWKIAYSGDTKPRSSFARQGKGATLVIHEATLEDDKPETAAEKGHSTFSQAIEVGREMEAKHILLNHFSQRYPKLPKSRVSSQEEGVVSISYDLMSVRIGDMWRMAYYIDAAEILFKTDEADDEGADVTDAVERDVNVDGKGEEKRKARQKEAEEKEKAKQQEAEEKKKAKQKAEKERKARAKKEREEADSTKRPSRAPWADRLAGVAGETAQAQGSKRPSRGSEEMEVDAKRPRSEESG